MNCPILDPKWDSERPTKLKRNFALLRKIALNLVAQDRGTQTSLRGRRKKAAWDDSYRLQIIAHQAHA